MARPLTRTAQVVPTSAKCVIIGAGIVGNCLVGHLSRLGWTDMVQIDKGPLPNPGGSTGHASNFIFPTDHNKEMAFLTLESQQQYIDHGLNNTSGGIEVARKPERLEEFKRRMTSAKAWGIDSRLVTPAEIKELVPFINEEILLGGFYTPSVSCVDSLETGTQMRNEAATGACRCSPTPRCSTSRPRMARRPEGDAVVTTRPHRGRVRASPAGVEPAHRQDGRANIPLTPPCTRWPMSARSTSCNRVEGSRLPDRARHGHVLLRAPDRRLDGGRLLRHRRSSCTPTTSLQRGSLVAHRTPFTADDFDQQFERQST